MGLIGTRAVDVENMETGQGRNGQGTATHRGKDD